MQADSGGNDAGKVAGIVIGSVFGALLLLGGAGYVVMQQQKSQEGDGEEVSWPAGVLCCLGLAARPMCAGPARSRWPGLRRPRCLGQV